MSRDDSGSFLPHYTELEIVKKNPFATIDQTGVAQLMQLAVEGRCQTRPGITPGSDLPARRSAANTLVTSSAESRVPGRSLVF